MGYENINIELKGINSSNRLERFVRNVADTIHWQSPSDACLKIICEQTRGAIKATCRIVSKTGVFKAEVAGDNPEKCVKKLEEEIQQKLVEWKKNRFFDRQLKTAS